MAHETVCAVCVCLRLSVYVCLASDVWCGARVRIRKRTTGGLCMEQTRVGLAHALMVASLFVAVGCGCGVGTVKNSVQCASHPMRPARAWMSA